MAKNLSHDPEFDGKVHKLSGMRATVEPTLEELVSQRWLEENCRSIIAFNEEIEKRGVWSENMRSW